MRYITVALLLVLLGNASAEERDVYVAVALRDLPMVEGKLPAWYGDGGWHWDTYAVSQPRVVLDGPGEAYLNAGVGAQRRLGSELVMRLPARRDVMGTLYLPHGDGENIVRVRFRVTAKKLGADARASAVFKEGKATYYAWLLDRGVPGSAWFRHQLRDVADDDERQRWRQWSGRASELEDTYAFLTGGRAVSENLQLGRALPTAKPEEATVPLASLDGITVKELDWSPYLKGVEKKSLPIERHVPADQYALFFPSFQAVVDLVDLATKEGTPILRAFEDRAEHARTRERYERQLGVSLDALARALGPRLITRVAVTGSDPYLRTGSDVALLFATEHPDQLVALLKARRKAAGATRSHLASTDDGLVVLSNSASQLRRVLDAGAGKAPSIASLDEFHFFRDRYPRGDEAETALLIVPDPAIRKWCGPRWRILCSRRVRAAAVMAELQAQHLDRLVKGVDGTEALRAPWNLVDAGELTLDATGVSSSIFGTPEFLTPIAELEVDKVTAREAELYGIWRAGYQRNWSNFFDPIAVRFSARPDRLAADVTVMPLIVSTDYAEFIRVAKGAQIADDAGDRHAGTLARLAVAINVDSPTMKQAGTFLRMMLAGAGGHPFSWMGESVAVYLDPDPVFAEAARAKVPDDYLEDNIHRLPIVVHCEVKSAMKLTIFLAGVRAWVQQTSPGMTVWETKKHGEQAYVRIGQKARGTGLPEKLAIYYAALPDALIVTLNEDVLKRALDRRGQRHAAKERGDAVTFDGPRLLGSHVSVHVDRAFLELMDQVGGVRREFSEQMKKSSWNNIPILNEWRRRYPGQDPVAVHERFFQTRLVCPGGGRYVWNEEWQTMESTAFGRPGAPREAAVAMPFDGFKAGNFGLTFEKDGLRAVCELTR